MFEPNGLSEFMTKVTKRQIVEKGKFMLLRKNLEGVVCEPCRTRK